MLSSLLTGDKDAIIQLLLSLPVILFSLTFHEVSHGYIAYKMGDPTARNLGRLTLNPAKHLDLMGTVAMLIFGFGWAKPVPINTRNFDNPRRGMALTGIAGPISNLILGVVSSLLFVIVQLIQLKFIYTSGEMSGVTFNIFYYLLTFLSISAYLNFGLMAFNLIPVPPFDGSRFFYAFLPTKIYFKVMKYEQIIMIVILVGFFALSRVGLSPVSFVADKLFSLIVDPLLDLGIKLIIL